LAARLAVLERRNRRLRGGGAGLHQSGSIGWSGYRLSEALREVDLEIGALLTIFEELERATR
jgi:hypothetical protein